MKNDPTYEELAEVIARYVHAHLYYPERSGGVTTWNFDHMYSSAYQIASGVLRRLEILAAMDREGQHSEFTCSPDEFADVIARNKENGCSYGMLMLALIGLAQQEETTKPQEPTGLRDYCIKIGLFEPAEAPVINLTAKGKAYDALYDDWDRLLEE